jgi:hypothetical protein
MEDMQKLQKHNKGYFPTPPGTCFVKPDLPFSDGTLPPQGQANWHPYIVVNENADFVECVMGKTLWSAKDPTKNHLAKLDRIYSLNEIEEPCPPMESKQTRRQYFDAAQLIAFPKAMLYDAENIKICNDGGYQLCQEEIKRMKAAVRENSQSRWATYSDPYDVESKKWSLDKYFPNHPTGSNRQLPDLSSIKDISQESQIEKQ